MARYVEASGTALARSPEAHHVSSSAAAPGAGAGAGAAAQQPQFAPLDHRHCDDCGMTSAAWPPGAQALTASHQLQAQSAPGQYEYPPGPGSGGEGGHPAQQRQQQHQQARLEALEAMLRQQQQMLETLVAAARSERVH